MTPETIRILLRLRRRCQQGFPSPFVVHTAKRRFWCERLYIISKPRLQYRDFVALAKWKLQQTETEIYSDEMNSKFALTPNSDFCSSGQSS